MDIDIKGSIVILDEAQYVFFSFELINFSDNSASFI